MSTLVHLRNGTPAYVIDRVHVPPFKLIGRQSNGTLELWQERGQWREDGTEHPLDIITVVTAYGATVAINAASK